MTIYVVSYSYDFNIDIRIIQERIFEDKVLWEVDFVYVLAV